MTFPAGKEVAGIIDWHRPHIRADGLSITLYEWKNKSVDHYGDPIADAYAIVARPNSCILSVADGVNWGPKPRLAARSALYGCIDHLHSRLFGCDHTPKTTRDLFHHLLRSFDFAQKEILSNGGTTTTLTIAVVWELHCPLHRSGPKWGLCVVSVGDSPCYVYRNESKDVVEVTKASHLGKGRDPRDCGGCLGANVGSDPDLSNLICCFTPVADNDIVFVTSDGISDNFDPVCLRQATAEPQSTAGSLPLLDPEERQELLLSTMAEVIRSRQETLSTTICSQDLIDALISHVIEKTDVKRAFLEDVWSKTQDPTLSPNSRRQKERLLSQQSKALPGKLDHATVAGYQVGLLRFNSQPSVLRDSRPMIHLPSASAGNSQPLALFSHLKESSKPSQPYSSNFSARDDLSGIV